MKELLKNLSAAKREIGAISKDSRNPFFKSKYFDINQLLEHVEPVLEKNGLIILQPITRGFVSTIIMDVKTGEEILSEIELPNIQDPQKLGSAITYYRRYTLASLLALQSTDDDANLASKQPTPTPGKRTFTGNHATAEKLKGTKGEDLKAKYIITDSQIKKYNEL